MVAAQAAVTIGAPVCLRRILPDSLRKTLLYVP